MLCFWPFQIDLKKMFKKYICFDCNLLYNEFEKNFFIISTQFFVDFNYSLNVDRETKNCLVTLSSFQCPGTPLVHWTYHLVFYKQTHFLPPDITPSWTGRPNLLWKNTILALILWKYKSLAGSFFIEWYFSIFFQ
jgi:hypothetical protein